MILIQMTFTRHCTQLFQLPVFSLQSLSLSVAQMHNVLEQQLVDPVIHFHWDESDANGRSRLNDITIGVPETAEDSEEVVMNSDESMKEQ